MSGIGIIGDIETPRSYCAHLYYTRKQMYEWRFYFVITRDLEATNMVVREHYGHDAMQVTMRVSFEHSEITLNIPEDGLVTKEGWRITPLTTPTISRKDVDEYKQGQRIPECQLIVQWAKEDQRPVQLRYKVDLIGAKPPFNYIHLNLIPAMEVETSPMELGVAGGKRMQLEGSEQGSYQLATSAPLVHHTYFQPPADQGMEQEDFPESKVQMKVAQKVQGQFGYQTVQLIKTKPLGTGSYGVVYKAMCDDLLCAGKILHPTLFQSSDPGAMAVMKRFEQECSVLSAIRHSNIVQYLGVHQDPDTQLPVLLMELMDESLTQFLEQTLEPLPYHTQVDICHDIALALAYLHSNGIIHRDLSSNNVLLIGRNKAKVTDFGMAKFFDANRTTMTPLTICPGTLAYMSPEALQDQPVYTKKLDTFSFGVLDIQIITRQFPNPGPRFKKVQDSRYPMGSVQVAIPDTERRKSHIDLINPSHPLLPIATVCLSYKEEDRPSAQELCHHLAALKEAPQYSDSVQQAQERSKSAQSAIADRERQIMVLQQQQKECNEQIKDLQHQLKVQTREKEAVIATKQKETQHLQEVTCEKDRDIEIREQQLQKLNQQLTACQQVTAQLKETIQESQEEKEHLQQQLDKVSQQSMVTQKDYLRGMDVIAEASVLITNQAHSFHWVGYGLKLHVPQGALPAGLEECRVLIKVGISGQFALPQNTSLVSAVYWLDSELRHRFSQPLTLEIQHCAMSSQTTRLSFALAKCSQKNLPYTFEILDGGEFSSLSAHGCIQLQHFSLVTTLMRLIMGEDDAIQYCAQLYVACKSANEWKVDFVVTKDLDSCSTVVKKEYSSHGHPQFSFNFSFKENFVSLKIPEKGELNGWNITPYYDPKITKEQVNCFSSGKAIPKCELLLRWSQKPPPAWLQCEIGLIGARDHSYFLLDLDPDSDIQQPTSTSLVPARQPSLQSASGIKELDEEDHTEITKYLTTLDKTHIYRLALVLGLSEHRAKSMKDSETFLNDVVVAWLQKTDQVMKRGVLTWQQLVEALKDETVGQNGIASTIAMDKLLK